MHIHKRTYIVCAHVICLEPKAGTEPHSMQPFTLHGCMIGYMICCMIWLYDRLYDMAHRMRLRHILNSHSNNMAVYLCPNIGTQPHSHPAFHVVCSHSRCMQPFTLYASIHVVCSHSRCMQPFTLYAAIHVVCSHSRWVVIVLQRLV
jgi:hypothetical protein